MGMRSRAISLMSPLLLGALGMSGMLGGCSLLQPAYEPAPPPPSGQALAYFYRTPLISGHLWDTAFKVDGKPIATLNDKEYTWTYLAAGKHIFEAEFHSEKVLQFASELNSGTTYFVECSQEIIGKNRIRNVIQLVPAQTGAPIIQEYSFETPD